ncbi:hypothetical protein CYLTODRAFT_446522 [Cylindrobasidium torrendii FP15055 ss-10]|uniref:SP-RING-type domain-containing protein n=1 Tax=Cylindrobasidium torrendii FP15055 ss-10 TaxID=1314674 RepID=A0A0D7AZC9_9AGAR|nr:hypothetical protein CYLTODRAFT_446522 [Cylindrobasidium torrendii FP15055 ss-10]
MARRNRHQASSDIDEQETTQRPAREDVEDEEQPTQPRRRASRKNEELEDLEDDGDDDEPIDIDNFGNHPLSDSDKIKLKNVVTDWQSMTEQVMLHVTTLNDVGVNLLQYTSLNEKEKWTDEVDQVYRDFIFMENTMSHHHQTLDAMYQAVQQGDQPNDLQEAYSDGVEKLDKAWKKKTTRQKYARHEGYKEFRQRLWESSGNAGGMPPVSELIPKEDGDESDDDDEVEIGGVTQDYKCPLTLAPLDNPLKSKICGHSYSGDAIRQYFVNSRESKSCPASGCNKKITLADCVSDKDFNKRLKAHRRMQKRREEEMEVDEVIE